jgi:predicted nucleic acid-binding protein
LWDLWIGALCLPLDLRLKTEVFAIGLYHDVYDCFYLALGRAADADKLVTTDRDVESLCSDEPFEYTNPVPEEVLSEFHGESS